MDTLGIDPVTGEVLEPKKPLGLTPELLAKLNETDVKKASMLVKAGIITTGVAQKLLGIPEENTPTRNSDSDPTLFSVSLGGGLER